MRTPFLHGAGIAIAQAPVNLGFFFAGIHSRADRLAGAQGPGTVLMLAVIGTGLTLALRERRAAYPPERDWGFAPAFGTGVLTGLCAALLGMLPTYLYFAVINPSFSDVLTEMQRTALVSKGLSEADIEKIMPMMEKFTGPGVLTATGAFMSLVWASLLALVAAFFLKSRPAASAPAGT